MIWCFLVLFAAFLCRLQLFAAVFWDVLKLALFATSVAPKWCQNAPQRPQNTAKIDPKLPPGAPRGPQVEPKSYFVVKVSILEPNLVPLGTQNRPKIDTLREKWSKKRAFKAMFDWRGASPHFLYPFLVIFKSKKRWKKHHVVVLLAGISYPWKTMYFTGYPAWGQCFCKYAEILKI